ncbi:MAG: helix-turn-helix transcriptional regulator [Erysipelotrichaceae bacterium]|nr:helix-turn-helix transcriptional regulator [Erysipelotrichaceae bacterium]MBR0342199.1 helix-turn-helix transcriptional regulator [Oscillospiraceae bacterium]
MDEIKIDWRQLGNRIAEMRMARGITQSNLAEKTGLSETYIGYLEQGKRHGNFDTYLMIVTALGFTLNDLTTDDLKDELSDRLAWELSHALSACGTAEQESIMRIVREMAHVIRMFHAK